MDWFWKPAYANCLIWALWMQLRFGGYVCWRKSKYGWWAHAVWSLDRVVWWEYIPINFSGRLRWWQVLWVVVFRGKPQMVVRNEL